MRIKVLNFLNQPISRLLGLRSSITGLLVCLLLAGQGQAFAQQDNACKELFKRAFDGMRKLEDSSMAVYYTVETTMSNDGFDKTAVSIKLNEGRSMVLTGNNKLFRDEEATVMIDDDRKVIFISKMDNELSMMKVGQMTLIQDSLLSQLPALSCQKTSHAKRSKLRSIRLGSEMKMISQIGLDWLEYTIDEKTEQIFSIEASYAAGHPSLKRMKVSYEMIDLSFDEEVFEGRALAQVYDDQGQVLEAYSQYKLIDKLKAY